MCQEQQTHPPVHVWLRTPRPNAPDVRPRCPPVQIILTLSACSPTGRDRRPVCAQTALVHHIDPLTICKMSKPVFRSAFTDRTSSWRTVPQHPRHKNEQLRTLDPSCPLTLLATTNGLIECYPVRCSEAPRRTRGTDLITAAMHSKTVFMFTASKLVIPAAMLRMRAGIADGLLLNVPHFNVRCAICLLPIMDGHHSTSFPRCPWTWPLFLLRSLRCPKNGGGFC